MHLLAHLAQEFTRVGFQDVEFFKISACIYSPDLAQGRIAAGRNCNWNLNRVSFLAPNETWSRMSRTLDIFCWPRLFLLLGISWLTLCAQGPASGFIALTWCSCQVSGQETHQLWPSTRPNDPWRVFNCRADDLIWRVYKDWCLQSWHVCFLHLVIPRQVEGFNCPSPALLSLCSESWCRQSQSINSPRSMFTVSVNTFLLQLYLCPISWIINRET